MLMHSHPFLPPPPPSYHSVPECDKCCGPRACVHTCCMLRPHAASIQRTKSHATQLPVLCRVALRLSASAPLALVRQQLPGCWAHLRRCMSVWRLTAGVCFCCAAGAGALCIGFGAGTRSVG